MKEVLAFLNLATTCSHGNTSAHVQDTSLLDYGAVTKNDMHCRNVTNC